MINIKLSAKEQHRHILANSTFHSANPASQLLTETHRGSDEDNDRYVEVMIISK